MRPTAAQIDYGVDAEINVSIIYQQFKWWSDEQKRVLEKKLFVSLANHLPHISWTKVVKFNFQRWITLSMIIANE